MLDSPVSDIATALAYHGYVQIDPINVCGRMQDLILRNRVVGYREGDLVRYLHGDPAKPLPAAERKAFEHHLPHSHVLTAMTFDAWPHLLAAMRGRSKRVSWWSGKMEPRQRRLAKTILAEIESRGPLSSDDIDDDRRDRQGWGVHASLAKTTLHKLFFHGQVMIARRVGTRRYYDLPGRVLPREVLALPEPTPAETARWVALLKLRQRRLLTMTHAELHHVRDHVQAIQIEGCPPLYCLRDDLHLLDAANKNQNQNQNPEPAAAPLLLAPLDPLIYDRRLTKRLWNFDYTWEVYTPPTKRVRGYYALPVLAGLELVGHIDPKADRENKKLQVVNRSLRRGARAATAVTDLARFLGIR